MLFDLQYYLINLILAMYRLSNFQIASEESLTTSDQHTKNIYHSNEHLSLLKAMGLLLLNYFSREYNC